MTLKLVQNADCPHCKKKIELETDVDSLSVDTKQVKSNGKATTEDIEKPEPEIKEVIKEVIKIPNHIPKFKCKNGNCGEMHKNENYTKRITGKCSNCGQFTSDINSECPFCNNKEYDELEEDELKDLGIPEPNEETHHEHD